MHGVNRFIPMQCDSENSLRIYFTKAVEKIWEKNEPDMEIVTSMERGVKKLPRMVDQGEARRTAARRQQPSPEGTKGGGR